MEINDTTKIIYQACHWYGCAPYTIIRNKRNQIVNFKLKWQFCVFSVILIIFFFSSVQYILVSGNSSAYLLRAKSNLLVIVYWLDLNFMLAPYVIHMVTSLSVKNTVHVNNLLNKVDKHLNVLSSDDTLHSNRARRQIKIAFFSSAIFIILALCVDFYNWLQIIWDMQSDEKSSGLKNNNQYAMIPFYIMYSTFVPIYGKLTMTIYRIGLRYRKLNDIICTYVAAAERLNCFVMDNRGLSDVSARLFTIHEMLEQIVNRVSSEFGLTILSLLMSSSLHVIISVYFLLSEVLESDAIIFIMTQIMWPLSHIIRIFLIIEPCHLISFEAKRTSGCVGRLLRMNRSDFLLEHFWQKLLIQVNLGFPICGLFYIDRSLLTSIGGAIATYLVIIFQFKNQ